MGTTTPSSHNPWLVLVATNSSWDSDTPAMTAARYASSARMMVAHSPTRRRRRPHLPCTQTERSSARRGRCPPRRSAVPSRVVLIPKSTVRSAVATAASCAAVSGRRPIRAFLFLMVMFLFSELCAVPTASAGTCTGTSRSGNHPERGRGRGSPRLGNRCRVGLHDPVYHRRGRSRPTATKHTRRGG